MTTILIEVPELPKNKQIHAYMAQSLESLACLFHDCEDDINLALTTSEDAKVTISHSICIDMAKDKQTDKLSVSIKRGDEITSNIKHPDQPEMFNRDGSVRDITPQAESPAMVGLPAPIEVIGMIDAEIIEEEEPNDDVWLLNATSVIDGFYEDEAIIKLDFPWCGIDYDGDVMAYGEKPELDDSVWSTDGAVARLGQLGGEVTPELWFWNDETWSREYPLTESSTDTEGGEEE
jgi:hypothetical protein